MIAFMSRLPVVGNCFKFEEAPESTYPLLLKQPCQIKVTTILKINDLVKTVVVVSLCVLLVCGLCFIPIIPWPSNNVTHVNANTHNPNQIPDYLRLYSNDVIGKTLPNSPDPIPAFPAYLQEVMYPGKISGGDGRLCVIPDPDTVPMPPFKECNNISSLFESVIQNTDPDTYEEYYNDPDMVNGEGGEVYWDAGLVETSILSITIGMDKRKVIAYQEALSYIEKEILNSPDFFENNASAIVQAIKKTNEFVTKYLNEFPGKLRNQIALLLRESSVTKKSLKNAFYQNGGSLQDVNNFNSLIDKLEKFNFIDFAMQRLTADELRVLKIVGFVTCQPNEIDFKLRNFANVVKELALGVKSKKVNAIIAAAYVHQGLSEIRPFMHGNGRVTRIWMNVILQIGGFKAIVMPHKVTYAAEVLKDLRSPGTFGFYLKDVIEWVRRQRNLL